MQMQMIHDWIAECTESKYVQHGETGQAVAMRFDGTQIWRKSVTLSRCWFASGHVSTKCGSFECFSQWKWHHDLIWERQKMTELKMKICIPCQRQSAWASTHCQNKTLAGRKRPMIRRNDLNKWKEINKTENWIQIQLKHGKSTPAETKNKSPSKQM